MNKNLDHGNLPDPVLDMIKSLQNEVHKLRQEVNELQQELQERSKENVH